MEATPYVSKELDATGAGERASSEVSLEWTWPMVECRRRTCTLPFLNPTLTVVVFCHCWNNVDASSLLYEPPYTEPYVRWCGRTAEVTPPPTRLSWLVNYPLHVPDYLC